MWVRAQCVCMSACVCVCMSACVCVCARAVCVYECVCVCVCMSACVCVCARCVCMSAYVCVCALCVYECMHVCVHVCQLCSFCKKGKSTFCQNREEDMVAGLQAYAPPHTWLVTCLVFGQQHKRHDLAETYQDSAAPKSSGFRVNA